MDLKHWTAQAIAGGIDEAKNDIEIAKRAITVAKAKIKILRVLKTVDPRIHRAVLELARVRLEKLQTPRRKAAAGKRSGRRQ